MPTPLVLVTGDVVLDCHLYGGIKTAATSGKEPGSAYVSHLGGAVLSRRLLDAAGQGTYRTYLGIDEAGLQETLPSHLHSYGVWTPHPRRKGAKDPSDIVWRVQKHFGYGPTGGDRGTQVFRCAADLPGDPGLILLDDGGILFRHRASEHVWPDVKPGSAESPAPFIVLKMSAPLCRGDLWPRLIEDPSVARRLLVLVSAGDLRREDVQIRKHLSWEQCVTDAMAALINGPLGSQLLKAAHVVVNFGSAGALWLRTIEGDEGRRAELIFDPIRLESEFGRDFDGTVYGFQTCLSVSMAHHILAAMAEGKANQDGIPAGIISGLKARRRLLEIGHGHVGREEPGFPVDDIGKVIAGQHGGFVRVTVPPLAVLQGPCPWSILEDTQRAGNSGLPHAGLGILAATYGRDALSGVPSLSRGNLFTVDRSEIESLRTIERLMRDYVCSPSQKRPLSIGVFGPPGAGKSFGVKSLAKAVLGDRVPVLEFNLSQFNGPEDLIGAFHRVRDEVLRGTTPVAFWDEFDAQRYRWLQYLLAPMQDGAFQEGQITHPIGKCIFIFAGGTADSLITFGVEQPPDQDPADRRKLSDADREDRAAHERDYQEFKLLKGPDFISRLHGHLDVLGPNPRKTVSSGCPDLTWPIRRALMLRTILGLRDRPGVPDELLMDPGLLYALLLVKEYRHGARSFEKVLTSLAQDWQEGRYHRSALPPDPLLDRETDARQFEDLLKQHNAFKTHPDIETLAAAIHECYLANAEEHGWTVRPEVDRSYADLAPDYQASNRAAARRIPDLLALISYRVVPDEPSTSAWVAPLKAQIAVHRERLAQAEHLGWNAERFANGWTLAPERDDALKQHNLLVDWAQLSEMDKQKDRENMDAIPDWLKMAGYKAVPI